MSLVLVIGCGGDNGGTDAGPGPVPDAGGMVDSGGGGGVDAGPMPGTDAGTDAGGGGACAGPTGPCNALMPSSCGAGMACVFTGSSDTTWETVCIASGVGTQGATCDPTMQGQCAEGFQCSSEGVCQRICCDSTECAPGDFCGLIAGADLGTCSTPDDCDLIAQTGCGAGLGCYPSGGSNLACAMAGTLTEGQECMFSNHCVPGFGCLGPMGGPAACRAWCDMTVMPTTCPAGQVCGGVGGLPVGACTPMP